MSKLEEINSSDFYTQTSEGKVLVDFWAAWCGPCVAMAPILEEFHEANDSGINVKKLNVDDYPEIAEQFGVRSIPTMIYFENGVEVKRVIGAMPLEVLASKLL